MPPQTDTSEREPYFIFTDEEADNLVREALDTSPDEPEPLVKLLNIIYEHEQELRLKESLYLLMRLAYNRSIVHSIDFQEYLEAIKEGRNPLEESRARFYGVKKSDT